MTEHTPGPWQYCGCGKCGQVYAPVADVAIARSYDVNDHETHGEGIPAPDPDTKVANARLIAAAPDLLDALERIVARLDTDWVALDGSNYDTQLAHSAIAKATGND